MPNIESSEYVTAQRRSYSLYVLHSRAVPAITDGLKSSQRRVLWKARSGEKFKTATLAGITMSIHPHSMPDGAINTLTAPYGNNIPLFTGTGAFGTLLEPKGYGASRYTSVKLSKFTQDVVMCDIEIIPMMENYDSTEDEPVHFLPLIPIVLLNASEGIAVGFASDILPRSLSTIIEYQLALLRESKKLPELTPEFIPLQNKCFKTESSSSGTYYYFKGEIDRKNSTTVVITKIPYGQNHKKVISKIENEIEKGNVIDLLDNSKDTINIQVKFKKGYLKTIDDEDILHQFGLIVKYSENLNVLNFSNNSILSPTPEELVSKFTNWRLEWYYARYLRLKNLVEIEIQKFLDIRTAIKHNIGGAAKKTATRGELKELLEQLKIVNVDYIADLPIYRFTEEENLKNEQRLVKADALLKQYNRILESSEERKMIYIKELQEVLQKYNKGYYN